MPKVFETDWLASTPVFYNELSGKVSNNINDVIDFNNFEFHLEGFNNYLDFGYSVLEQTPIQHVKFLRHSSRLTVSDDGKLEIEYLDDPVEKWIGKTSHEDDVFHLLYSSVNEWEKSVTGEIIIPTSGGYDSRLLNLLIQDKSRIRSFTYGWSKNQIDSQEVVYAQKLSEILGTKWENILLGDFHLYLQDWDNVFGISTHSHGMYHIEFYKKILPKVSGNNPLLSGIVGDVWSGAVKIPNITSPSDLLFLGYRHGFNADSSKSLLPKNNYLMEQYYIKNKEKLASPMFRIVEAMRFKIMLLSYLFAIPRSFGFKPWSPFLNKEIALSMLTLPAQRRKDRIWQQEFFKKHGVHLESMNLKVNRERQEDLNYRATRRVALAPLDIDLLSEVIKPEYVEWINSHYQQQRSLMWELIFKLNQRQLKGTRRVLSFLNLNSKEPQRVAYNAYLTLKPIENLLKQSNNKLEPLEAQISI